jgi:hypothetical protein
MERKRVEFLMERTDIFEEAERLSRFLAHMRRTSRADRSGKMQEFLKWGNAHIASLRQSCTADAVDDDVAESDLW